MKSLRIARSAIPTKLCLVIIFHRRIYSIHQVKWNPTSVICVSPSLHLLLMACVAPRKLLVEGFDDPFYDTSAIGPRIGYVHRSERHGLSAYDWTWIMDFVERKD